MKQNSPEDSFMILVEKFLMIFRDLLMRPSQSISFEKSLPELFIVSEEVLPDYQFHDQVNVDSVHKAVQKGDHIGMFDFREHVALLTY